MEAVSALLAVFFALLKYSAAAGNGMCCSPSTKGFESFFGFCAASSDLDTKCADLEVSVSENCEQFEGSWCCYVPSAATIFDNCEKGSNGTSGDRLFVVGSKRKDQRLPGVPRKPRKVRTTRVNCQNVGSPLILTPLIRSGNIKAAQQQSQVFLPGSNLTSFSGYFTVNTSDNSQMYFWFFQAEVPDPTSVPVVLFLSGGPGSSSLFGAFVEMGPFRVDANLQLSLLPERWTKVANMLFIDNPVGTGFSFTNTNDGYSRTQDQVGQNVYQALFQFYTMFPQYQTVDFYMTGESYAGKFVAAAAVRITQENPKASIKIPLKGIAIGNGYVDPLHMMNYGDLLFQIGMINDLQRDTLKMQEQNFDAAVQDGRLDDAMDITNSVMGYPGFFYQFTKSEYYYNYLHTKEPAEFYWYDEYLDQCSVRSAIHVGSQVFADLSDQVCRNLQISDYMEPATDLLINSIQNYRVMLYNGVLDIICTHPLVEAYVKVMDWPGAAAFRNAPKLAWKVDESDSDIAGYIQQSGNFSIVAVRNAGHILPYDNPRAALDMITRFINNKSFRSVSANREVVESPGDVRVPV